MEARKKASRISSHLYGTEDAGDQQPGQTTGRHTSLQINERMRS